MIKLKPKIVVPNERRRDVNFKQKNLKYGEPIEAIEPHSTFCFCERYIESQNSVKLLAELRTYSSHPICSQPLLS